MNQDAWIKNYLMDEAEYYEATGKTVLKGRVPDFIFAGVCGVIIRQFERDPAPWPATHVYSVLSHFNPSWTWNVVDTLTYLLCDNIIIMGSDGWIAQHDRNEPCSWRFWQATHEQVAKKMLEFWRNLQDKSMDDIRYHWHLTGTSSEEK